ncbi:hypothetical protein L6R52_40225 [Myxococcota bacterium]|nr:hypothetical protein [Myxococcota bacterium]
MREEELENQVVPLSREVFCRSIAPAIDEARAACRDWLACRGRPAFDEIALLAVPALETMMERGWVTVHGEWATRLEASFRIARDPSDLRFRGRIAEIVEILWWATRDGAPGPSGGPVASMMEKSRPR